MLMKEARLVFLVCLILVAFAGCSNPSGGSAPAATPSHVYIGGAEGTSSIGPYPVYWKDTQLNEVSTTVDGYALYVVATGGNVYLGGASQSLNCPAYWINGARTLCDITGYTNGWPQGLVVSGTNVYIAGGVNTGGIGTPAYWKDGARTDLILLSGDTSVWFSANSNCIVSAGSNIYVLGNSATSTSAHPAYWQVGNATAHPLPLEAGYGYTAGAIYGGTVSGTDWYVAGEEWGSSNPELPIYWQDGNLGNTLQLPSHYAGGQAQNIAVAGSDVFAVGEVIDQNYTGAVPVLWKNGQPTILTPPNGVTGSAMAYHVAVSGSTVYVVGSTCTPPGGANGQAPWLKPLYWTINGSTVTATALTWAPTAGPNAKVDGIVISGSDVYVSATIGTKQVADNGQLDNSKAVYPGFWKNGSWTALSVGTNFDRGGTGGISESAQ